MDKRTESYQREKLYDEVWKKPVLIVAKRYGVRLLRIHYRRGDIDGIEFAPKDTSMDDLLK